MHYFQSLQLHSSKISGASNFYRKNVLFVLIFRPLQLEKLFCSLNFILQRYAKYPKNPNKFQPPRPSSFIPNGLYSAINHCFKTNSLLQYPVAKIAFFLNFNLINQPLSPYLVRLSCDTRLTLVRLWCDTGKKEGNKIRGEN